ncbi:hypothetical protein Acsp04_00310 [Actinomadura sp. NBRC 104425]|nr:hypothetical protein [Actinomadura sp. NBRC 104425]GLZ09795.1 hypothetical protein Acsp04_00310 [Actinomadura sp. NBRC 104425]
MRAPFVTRTAVIGLPFSDVPMSTALAMSGWAAAALTISSRMFRAPGVGPVDLALLRERPGPLARRPAVDRLEPEGYALGPQRLALRPAHGDLDRNLAARRLTVRDVLVVELKGLQLLESARGELRAALRETT